MPVRRGMLSLSKYNEMWTKVIRYRATDETIAFVKDIENKTTLEGNDDGKRMDCYIKFCQENEQELLCLMFAW